MEENPENIPENAETPQEPQDDQAAGQTDQGSPQPQEVSQDAKTMAMLCHLLGLLTNFLGPLILWLVKKDDDPFIDHQGKEALNFQITVAIASIVSGLLTFVCIGALLLPAVGVVDLVFSIIACVNANKGQAYRYPVSIRFVK